MAFFRKLFSGHPATQVSTDTSPIRASNAEIETLLLQHRPSEALDALGDVAPPEPDRGRWFLLKARATRSIGRPSDALLLCDEALLCDCDPTQVHLESAACHRELHNLQAALDALSVATSVDPEAGPAWLAMGEVLLKLQRVHEALETLRKAEQHLEEPGPLGTAKFHLGLAYAELGLIAEACTAYRACIELVPDLAGPYIALGHALIKDDDELAALDCYEKALQRAPNVWEAVRLNMAIAMVNIGRYDEARRHLESALAAKPGDHTARWYLAQLDLLQCRWETGWSNFGARFGAGSSPYRPMPYAPWQGESLNHETLLILADQGLGDEIMFASCFEDVRARVRHCIVECEPRLHRLFERSFPDFTIVPTRRENDTAWLQGLPEPNWQVPGSDLPTLLRRHEKDFPTQRRSFLLADPERRRTWADRLTSVAGDRLKVGISWRGGITGTRTKARSIGISQWEPILRTPGVAFFNLQYGEYQDDLAGLQQTHGVTVYDFPEAIPDYDETAALVSSLDLVISVCTAVVHLAGALGTPVWILTPFAPGWRYTANRESMPWYPSTRIFRQASVGDWESACQKLSLELSALTKQVSL